MNDEKLATLMADGRHDAVLLYFAAIAWSHQQDTDGVIPHRARRLLIHNIHTDESAFEVLLRADLLRAPKGGRTSTPAYTINAYNKWQTTSDQRQRHADVMRRLRSRDDHEEVTESSHDDHTPVTESSPLSRVEKSREEPPYPPFEAFKVAPEGVRWGEVLEKLIDAEAVSSGAIRNPEAWRHRISDRLQAEHGDRITKLVLNYPDAPVDVIASTIRGESNNLRLYVHHGTKNGDDD